MITRKMTRRALAVFMLAAMIMSSVTVFSFGASNNKKMTAYTQVYVKGKYAYCLADKGIYRVNLKTDQVKRISKKISADEGNYQYFKLYKGYIYYEGFGTAAKSFYRVKTSGKKFKKLGKVFDFAISKGKIYYTAFSDKTGGEVDMQMSLSGKNKRRSAYHPKPKFKASNKKGYKVKSITEKDYETTDNNGVTWHIRETGDYLVTPQGKKIRLWEGEGESEEKDVE